MGDTKVFGNQTHYVVGLAFYENNVLLTQKTHPPWQEGKYNGLGGKVKNESIDRAMVRKFLEEAGTQTSSLNWIKVVTLVFPHCEVHFYATQLVVREFEQIAKHILKQLDMKSKKVERIAWFNEKDLPPNLVRHMDWMIRLVRDCSIPANAIRIEGCLHVE